MTEDIPTAVRHADEQHYRILQRVPFSRHLNPNNAREAQRAFRAGADAPPFTYNPLLEADELLRHLERIRPRDDHPAAALVGRLIDGTTLLVLALRDRTAARFDALARHADWYPADDLLSLRFPDPPADTESPDRPSSMMIERLRKALLERGLDDWRIESDTVMSARVLVDSAKRLLRVNPQARFKPRDLRRLVAHEIDVHVMRAHNGQRQVLRCFSTGLPGSLTTEEGLALVAEEQVGAASPGVLNRQVEVVRAIHQARTAGFREVYQTVAHRHGPGLAWGICLRIKRGLANPGFPGVYAKDSVYLRGRMLVRSWLDAGNPVQRLYVGKVALTDPVDEWVEQGWLRPGRLPALWKRAS
ncbi:MAG: tyrosine/phenylalanine carboxypeptidase domain-containing protein [Myxococcota bacterium]